MTIQGETQVGDTAAATSVSAEPLPALRGDSIRASATSRPRRPWREAPFSKTYPGIPHAKSAAGATVPSFTSRIAQFRVHSRDSRASSISVCSVCDDVASLGYPWAPSLFSIGCSSAALREFVVQLGRI
jgi:hypothetical protein